ncbi:MAG: glutamine amidotransferase [Lachnospiraceae bacterium]|nr:glutamine amidotransferase [Lachnospiraceae bacterium]MDY5741857.1 glutamine amidotransferase [Lachnospiraceae bacterium]
MKIVIGHLYPDLLNLYGDRGNIQCMQQRLHWRGIESEVIRYEAGMKIDFDALDIILLGGGSDREQKIVCEYLKEIRDDFKQYVEAGKVVLAVCGGYQLLGKYYETDEGLLEGLSILNIETRRGKGRLIDNIVLQSPLADMPVVGFENHGGRTDIHDHKPFGKVLTGHGNDDESGYEGVIYKHVLGTYIHGPLLPKNPQVCDWLLSHALEHKYGEICLSSLPDKEERLANDRMVSRILKEG